MLTELGDMSSSASLQLKTVLIKMPAPLHAGDSLQDSISLILPHILVCGKVRCENGELTETEHFE